MSDPHLRRVIRHLSRVIGPEAGGNVPDGELLERFLTHRDEAAFEVLVWRHAATVFGVCRASCATAKTPRTPSRPPS
jgi:hypothetical protein